MKAGRAFELLIENILISIGFSKVKSDGRYVFDAGAGQMLQGLGEAHNADVLLEPPVQTPFYAKSRILVECKWYAKKVGLNTLRSALGLKEDVNHFEIVDKDELDSRRNLSRPQLRHTHTRYAYQVAVASRNGFTIPAQNFAATHRISLIEFDKMPFWGNFINLLVPQNPSDPRGNSTAPRDNSTADIDKDIKLDITEEEISAFVQREIRSRIALAITPSGQMLFLYKKSAPNGVDHPEVKFGEEYKLEWDSPSEPWTLSSEGNEYLFQLPEELLLHWLNNAEDETELKIDAIHLKEEYFSNMIVYYKYSDRQFIQMISIDRNHIFEALKRLKG